MRHIAILAALAAATPAAAGPLADEAAALMARGHGATCSLAMEPTLVDGYYPCIDFGPYRLVREYGRTSGFVVGKGRKPFRVFVSDGEGERFVVGGPWETDMAGRLALTFGAGSTAAGGSEAADAEAYVRGVISPQAPAGTAAPAAGPAPSAAAAPAPAPAGGSVPAPTAGGPPDAAIRAALEAIGAAPQ